MDFEVGDICKLRNGDLVTVTQILINNKWCIYCKDDDMLDDTEMIFDAFGRYNGSGYPCYYDIVKIYKKDKYPEMYI